MDISELFLKILKESEPEISTRYVPFPRNETDFDSVTPYPTAVQTRIDRFARIVSETSGISFLKVFEDFIDFEELDIVDRQDCSMVVKVNGKTNSLSSPHNSTEKVINLFCNNWKFYFNANKSFCNYCRMRLRGLKFFCRFVQLKTCRLVHLKKCSLKML